MRKLCVKIAIWLLVLAVFVAVSELILARKGYYLASREPVSDTKLGVISRKSRNLVGAKRSNNILVVGCSFTEATGVSVENNYVSLLNEIVPSCYFDNAGHNGAGPLQCWANIRAGLKVRHYDAVIYCFINSHLARDLGYYLENYQHSNAEQRSDLLLGEHYDIEESSPDGAVDLVYTPQRTLIWPLDNRLRIVNFAKCFTYDLYYTWRNAQSRRLLSGAPEEWDNNPWVLKRFQNVLRGMQADCNQAGAKFGSVVLSGAGEPYSTLELTPTGSEDSIPILDATYPLSFIPYTLCRDNDTVCYNHPNIDGYRFFAKKIAHWMKDTGLLSSDTQLLPVPPRFCIADTDADSDDVLSAEGQYVMPNLTGNNVSLRLRNSLKSLSNSLRQITVHLEEFVEEKDISRVTCALYGIESYPLSLPMISRELNLLRSILVPNKSLPADLRALLDECEAEIKREEPKRETLSDYLEKCASELYICNVVFGDQIMFRKATEPELRYNRALVRLAQQLVYTRSKEMLEMRIEEVERCLEEIKGGFSNSDLATLYMVSDIIKELRQKLATASAQQIQQHIAQYARAEVVDDSQNCEDDKCNARQDNVNSSVMEISQPFEIERKGTGKPANAGDLLTVHYECRLEDDTVIVSTRQRGRALQYPLWAGYMLHGMEIGVDGMRKGEIRSFVVNPGLAYSPGDYAYLPTGHTLHYKVELLDIKRPANSNQCHLVSGKAAVLSL